MKVPVNNIGCRCRNTPGKLVFETKKLAKLFIGQHIGTNPALKNMEIYHCGSCTFYHFTTRVANVNFMKRSRPEQPEIVNQDKFKRFIRK